MSTTLDRLAEIEKQLEEIRELEKTRAEKLSLAQLLMEAELQLSKDLSLLRKIKPSNGTEYDEIRARRESLTRYLEERRRA